jgi:hypothetical protein
LNGVSLRRPRDVSKIGFPALKERQMDQDYTIELFAEEIPAAFLCTQQRLRGTVEKATTKEATR